MKGCFKFSVIFLIVLILIVLGLYALIKIGIKVRKDNHNLEITIDNVIKDNIVGLGLNSVVVGVIKNDTQYIQKYENPDNESDKVSTESIFELASASKVFTTSVLQILVDEGTLNLNQKVTDFIPSQYQVSEKANDVTLRHLACHTSGFPSLPDSFIDKITDDANPFAIFTKKDIYDYLKNCDNKKKSGSYDYSNFGMGLLGHILELKMLMPLEDIIKQKLINPLQMKMTFITPDSTNKSKIIQGYDEDGNQNPVWIDNALTGAGSFLSNAENTLLFLKANFKGQSNSLSKSLIKTHAKQYDGTTGLGWHQPSFVEKLMGIENWIWHNGMAGGYSSYISVNPEKNIGVVILSNKSIDITSLGMDISSEVELNSWKAN